LHFIVQQLRFISSAIPQQWCSVRAAIARRLRLYYLTTACASFAHRLRFDCASIVQ
jgi:hypothetical protein